MNLRQGIIWAYRLLLNREPENEAVISAREDLARNPSALAWEIVRSREYESILDRAESVLTAPWDADWEEGIAWAYRLLLRREASEAEIKGPLPRNCNGLRLAMLTSREYELGIGGLDLLRDFAVVNAFAPFPTRMPVADSFVDFIGSRTRVDYLDGNWRHRAGMVENSVPRDSAPSLHGTAEWIGGLRSVLEAGDSLTVMELGAGWAPWLVSMSLAARHRGIEKLNLTGVEASAEHHGFSRMHFRANGLDPDAHALHRAVVGVTDGVARFPRLHVASDDYGANAVFSEHEADAATWRGELEDVKCLSLSGLIDAKDRVDLLHVDIQGHEATVLASAIQSLNARVRRIVVGTHSRLIEDQLFSLFGDHGWVCEADLACRMQRLAKGGVTLSVDGEQVWRNDRLGI